MLEWHEHHAHSPEWVTAYFSRSMKRGNANNTRFTDGQVKVVTSALERDITGSLTFIAPCFEHCMMYEKCIEERIHHGNMSLHVRFVHLHVFISTTTSYCMVSLFTCTSSFQHGQFIHMHAFLSTTLRYCMISLFTSTPSFQRVTA